VPLFFIEFLTYSIPLNQRLSVSRRAFSQSNKIKSQMNISLAQPIRSSKKTRRGFTLIEAIIVITVLGILAAVIVPRIAGITGASEAAVAAAEQGRINALIEQVYAAGGTLPSDTSANLIAALTAGVTEGGITFRLSEAPSGTVTISSTDPIPTVTVAP
jgi:prepilin-type N-terminal cleavage/methylation domain-containing protein